jgi:hypothetical protein
MIDRRKEREDSSFVFGLWGEWGSGKSNMIKFMKGRLTRTRVIEFNPWMFSGDDKLLGHFFTLITNTLYPKDDKIKIKLAVRMALIVTIISTIICGVGFPKLSHCVKWSYVPFWLFSILLLSYAAKLKHESKNLVSGQEEKQVESLNLSEKRKIISEWADIASNFGESLNMKWIKPIATLLKPSEDKVEDVKERTSNLFKYSKEHILIIIDDLDRLLPDEILQILRLVKSVADFPNVTYLISGDQAHIAKALKAAKVVNDIQSGYDYLEKLVQVSLPMPIPKEGRLKAALDKVLRVHYQEPYPEGFDQFINDIFLSHWITKPRDIIRFQNLLLTTYPIFKCQTDTGCKTIGAPSFAAFVSLQAMQLFDNKLYWKIRNARYPSDIFIIFEEYGTTEQGLLKSGNLPTKAKYAKTVIERLVDIKIAKITFSSDPNERLGDYWGSRLDGRRSEISYTVELYQPGERESYFGVPHIDPTTTDAG